MPSDTKRVLMVYGRQSCDARKMEEYSSIDVGNSVFGEYGSW